MRIGLVFHPYTDAMLQSCVFGLQCTAEPPLSMYVSTIWPQV